MRIEPGAQSSARHAHSKQDEFIWVIEGEVVLETNNDFGPDSGLFLRCTDDGRAYQCLIDYHKGGTLGGILFGGTVLTVAMYYVHIPSVVATIAIALLIASVKAGFVAAVFMHLSDERKMIYGVLICTVFFLIGLMGLTIWAMHDFPFFTLVDGKPA